MSTPEFCFVIYIGFLFLGLIIFIILLNKSHKKKETVSDDDDNDEDDLMDYDDKKTFHRDKDEERCSFCGGEGHSLMGCPLFLSTMMS